MQGIWRKQLVAIDRFVSFGKFEQSFYGEDCSRLVKDPSQVPEHGLSFGLSNEVMNAEPCNEC